jgi:hypothetical protein
VFERIISAFKRAQVVSEKTLLLRRDIIDLNVYAPLTHGAEYF